MAFPQATIRYPGIPDEFIVGGSYTCAHGISPGIITLVIAPNTSVGAKVGEITIRFGKVRINLPGCAIDTGSLRGGSGSARTWSVRLLDRRWKWKYTEPVNGRYNVRDAAKNIDTKVFKERTPQQLAEICLKAMGETGFDVSKLPNDSRPEITWTDENAAEMLDELVNSLGCRVVYDFLDDKVRIFPEGKGKELPRDELATNLSIGHSRETTPSSLLASFAPTVYQAKWELEPLGEETDGRYLPIDELSYRPAGGWGDPGDLDDPEKTYKRDGVEHYVSELAEKTVYRIWRIKSLAGYVPGIIGFGGGGAGADVLTAGKIDQVLLNDHLIETTVDEKGISKPRPAVVEGEFFSLESDADYGKTAPGTPWPHGFSIDHEKRVVILSGGGDFGAHRLSEDGDEKPIPATLYLHTSYTIIDTDLGNVHHTIRRDISKTGTGPKIIKVPYIGRTVKQVYKEADNPGKVSTNDADLKKEADKLFAAEQEKFKPHRVDDLEYAGVRDDIHLDGAIQQISIRVGGGQPATTRAGRNNEPDSSMPSYEERRRRERAAAAEARESFRKIFDTVTTFGEDVLKRARSLLPWS